MNGYRELREGAAWLDVSARAKIRVTGEDRARLLHAMTTNDVKKLAPGEGCYAFFLSAQGRVLADVNILCRAEDLLLDTEPETHTLVYEHLDKFIIADDATLEDLTSATVTIAIDGPAAGRALASMGAPVPAAALGHLEWGSRLVARISLTGSSGFLVMAPAGERDELVRALEEAGIAAADRDAFRVVRLEHGHPRFSEDITERFLTQETNQMQAVSFQKGCYLGQEIVERVRSRAQIHRRLLPLEIDASQPPAPGTKFETGGKLAAELMSAAYSPALGHTVGLAYVRIDSKPGDTLQAGDIRATVLGAPQPQSLESETCH